MGENKSLLERKCLASFDRTKKMNNLDNSKISFYSIQDMLNHLGITNKWKYLEALKYKMKF